MRATRPSAPGSGAILPGSAAKPVVCSQLRSCSAAPTSQPAKPSRVTGVIGTASPLSDVRCGSKTDLRFVHCWERVCNMKPKRGIEKPQAVTGAKGGVSRESWVAPQQASRHSVPSQQSMSVTDGRHHDLSRQQELLVLVAAAVAGAEADRGGVRRGSDPAQRADDAEHGAA